MLRNLHLSRRLVTRRINLEVYEVIRCKVVNGEYGRRLVARLRKEGVSDKTQYTDYYVFGGLAKHLEASLGPDDDEPVLLEPAYWPKTSGFASKYPDLYIFRVTGGQLVPDVPESIPETDVD